MPFPLPNTAIEWVTTIGLVITGSFALYSLFDKNFRSRKDQVDATDDRLITLLKDEVEVLQRQMVQQGNDIKAMKILIEELRKENEIFRAVFQNRDPDSIAMRDEARRAIVAIYDTQKDIRELYMALNKHFDSLEKAQSGPVKETIVKTTEKV